MNYYNEFDPKAAAWLRELIAAGLIPPGDVDERDIRRVSPDDLRGYRQCHFFAGIGGWSLALQLAGWPADRPVWTGSCPCQPFSAAGKGKGEADERHLWPDFYRLIRECRPSTVFGEQVASAAGLRWLDGVCASLEESAYAVGAADLCAAGVGAPHIRQRLYWCAVGVADADGRVAGDGGLQPGREYGQLAADGGTGGGLGDADGSGLAAWTPVRFAGEPFACEPDQPSSRGDPVRLGDPSRTGLQERIGNGGIRPEAGRPPAGQAVELRGDPGFWSAYSLIPCRDGKARRVEPGTFPLAHGVSGRVGLLRGYGNAIVPQVAAQFIGAFLEAEGDL